MGKKRKKSQDDDGSVNVNGNGGGETHFPEGVIHLIQSFLPRGIAARTSLVSKSWYHAWSTRPNLDFSQIPFSYRYKFWILIKDTIQRYESSNLNIRTLRMDLERVSKNCVAGFDELLAKAEKIGLKDIHVCAATGKFGFFNRILESEALEKLTLRGCGKWLDQRPLAGKVLFSKLKSLKLMHLTLSGTRDPAGRDILSLMFPHLEDFTLYHCRVSQRIQISSSSLRCITLEYVTSLEAEFDVPNIEKFKFLGTAYLPYVYVETLSKGWEADVCLRYAPYFLYTSDPKYLKSFLTNLTGAKISLGFTFGSSTKCYDMRCTGNQGRVVENLKLSTEFPSEYERFLEIIFTCCPPKFITLEGEGVSDDFVKFMYEELIQDSESRATKIRERFSMRGLGRVSLECFDVTNVKWLPISSNTWLHAAQSRKCELKVRYRLEWHGENAHVHSSTKEPDSEALPLPFCASPDPSAHSTNSTSEDRSSSAPDMSLGTAQEEVQQVQQPSPPGIPFESHPHSTNPTPASNMGGEALEALIQEVRQELSSAIDARFEQVNRVVDERFDRLERMLNQMYGLVAEHLGIQAPPQPSQDGSK